MAKLSKFVVVPLVAAIAAGCSGARGGASPEPDARVTIEVRNTSVSPIRVQLCTSSTCLDQRLVQGRGHTVYRFQPPAGDRANVTAWTAPVTRETRAPLTMSRTLPRPPAASWTGRWWISSRASSTRWCSAPSEARPARRAAGAPDDPSGAPAFVRPRLRSESTPAAGRVRDRVHPG